MNQVVAIVIVALITGVVSLFLGLVVRSARLALGCAVTGAMLIVALASAFFLYGLLTDWRIFQATRIVR